MSAYTIDCTLTILFIYNWRNDVEKCGFEKERKKEKQTKGKPYRVALCKEHKSSVTWHIKNK